MKQEDKDLLLKDLCGRLPYSVKIQTIDIWTNKSNKIETLNDIFIPEDNIPRCGEGGVPIEYVKPYLFPISSMTEEQKSEFFARFIELELKYLNGKIKHYEIAQFEIDFYNKKHLDYRGLIPKELALDATGLNIY